MDDIEALFEDSPATQVERLPSKSFSQMLAEGVEHKGGLVWLAAAERAGTLFGGPPRRPKLRVVK